MNGQRLQATEDVVELERALSNPACKFKQLLVTWRALPPDTKPQPTASKRRRQHRAEERLGPESVAKLVADYRAGIPTTQLMRSYCLGKGAVLRLLEANGVPRRRQGLTTEQTAEAVQLYSQGLSLTRIGARFGKDHGVISRALTQAGIRLTSL